MSDRIFTGIETGETRIRLLVARQRKESLRVIAHGAVPSAGIERGQVTDVPALAAAMQNVVRSAERELGIPLDDAVLTIPSSAVLAVHSHGMVEPSGAGRMVTERDGARAVARAHPHLTEGKRELVHLLPTHYMLDDEVTAAVPIGRRGRELTVFVCGLAGETAVVRALREAARLAGLANVDIVGTPIASAFGVLTEGEQRLGAILMEIGARSTTLSLVRNGVLMDATTIPVGGRHLTNDLSIAFSIPFEAAEQLKLQHGTVAFGPGPAEVSVVVSDGKTMVIKRSEVVDVLRERAREVLSLASRRLQMAGYGEAPTGGIVLAGGSAQLHGFAQLAQEVFQTPVRIGKPRGMETIPAPALHPAWASPVGALVWKNASLIDAARPAARIKANGSMPLTARLAHWARGLFAATTAQRGEQTPHSSEVIEHGEATRDEAVPTETVGAVRRHTREE